MDPGKPKPVSSAPPQQFAAAQAQYSTPGKFVQSGQPQPIFVQQNGNSKQPKQQSQPQQPQQPQQLIPQQQYVQGFPQQQYVLAQNPQIPVYPQPGQTIQMPQDPMQPMYIQQQPGAEGVIQYAPGQQAMQMGTQDMYQQQQFLQMQQQQQWGYFDDGQGNTVLMPMPVTSFSNMNPQMMQIQHGAAYVNPFNNVESPTKGKKARKPRKDKETTDGSTQDKGKKKKKAGDQDFLAQQQAKLQAAQKNLRTETQASSPYFGMGNASTNLDALASAAAIFMPQSEGNTASQSPKESSQKKKFRKKSIEDSQDFSKWKGNLTAPSKQEIEEAARMSKKKPRKKKFRQAEDNGTAQDDSSGNKNSTRQGSKGENSEDDTDDLVRGHGNPEAPSEKKLKRNTRKPEPEEKAEIKRVQQELTSKGGPWLCQNCKKEFKLPVYLAMHIVKGCSAGICAWCEQLMLGGAKTRGPDGEDLCSQCGSLSNFGYAEAPKRGADGKFACMKCEEKFESVKGLIIHRRYCFGAVWACEWCGSKEKQAAKTKGAGPNGQKTLCSSCASRYKSGRMGPPAKDVDGNYVCVCGWKSKQLRGLLSHERTCRGGLWECTWCKINEFQAKGKTTGPDGPSTLCGSCGLRFRKGYIVCPPQDGKDKKYYCEACGWKGDSMRAVCVHQRDCTGGKWNCEWCNISEKDARGKALGPGGDKSLCTKCGSRFKHGCTKPTIDGETGRVLCDECGRSFETFTALAGHRRFCDGGNWECDWCQCTASQAGSKTTGPKGPRTLCSACGTRFRSGYNRPPPRDASGKYVCPVCEKRFDTIGGLGSHGRFCSGLKSLADVDSRAVAVEDLTLGGGSPALPDRFASECLPASSVGDALQVWDLLAYLRGRIVDIPEIPWTIFEESLSANALDLEKSYVMHQVFMIFLRYLVDQAPARMFKETNPFEARVINANTWPELLRLYLVELARDVQKDHLSLTAHEIGFVASMLEQKDFCDLDICDRVELLKTISDMLLETPKVREHLDSVGILRNKVRTAKRSKFDEKKKEIMEAFNKRQFEMADKKSDPKKDAQASDLEMVAISDPEDAETGKKKSKKGKKGSISRVGSMQSLDGYEEEEETNANNSIVGAEDEGPIGEPNADSSQAPITGKKGKGQGPRKRKSSTASNASNPALPTKKKRRKRLDHMSKDERVALLESRRVAEAKAKQDINSEFEERLREIGKNRREALGQDRNFNTYWILGQDFSRLLCQKQASNGGEAWIAIQTNEELQAFLESLRKEGHRECRLIEAVKVFEEQLQVGMKEPFKAQVSSELSDLLEKIRKDVETKAFETTCKLKWQAEGTEQELPSRCLVCHALTRHVCRHCTICHMSFAKEDMTLAAFNSHVKRCKFEIPPDFTPASGMLAIVKSLLQDIEGAASPKAFQSSWSKSIRSQWLANVRFNKDEKALKTATMEFASHLNSRVLKSLNHWQELDEYLDSDSEHSSQEDDKTGNNEEADAPDEERNSTEVEIQAEVKSGPENESNAKIICSFGHSRAIHPDLDTTGTNVKTEIPVTGSNNQSDSTLEPIKSEVKEPQTSSEPESKIATVPSTETPDLIPSSFESITLYQPTPIPYNTLPGHVWKKWKPADVKSLSQCAMWLYSLDKAVPYKALLQNRRKRQSISETTATSGAQKPSSAQKPSASEKVKTENLEKANSNEEQPKPTRSKSRTDVSRRASSTPKKEAPTDTKTSPTKKATGKKGGVSQKGEISAKGSKNSTPSAKSNPSPENTLPKHGTRKRPRRPARTVAKQTSYTEIESNDEMTADTKDDDYVQEEDEHKSGDEVSVDVPSPSTRKSTRLRR
eukprot:m.116845 g.116845  ORF g.116845 m.116845 type:complete len:1829 (+) comp14242_c1_seq1:380-5866(+)